MSRSSRPPRLGRRAIRQRTAVINGLDKWEATTSTRAREMLKQRMAQTAHTPAVRQGVACDAVLLHGSPAGQSTGQPACLQIHSPFTIST
jgi:hypothetical protein